MKWIFVWAGLFGAMGIGPIALCDEANDAPKCEDSFCVFVRHDEFLADESALLVDTLRLRLCKFGVQVPDGSESFETSPRNDQSHPGVQQTDPPSPGGCPNLPRIAGHGSPKWWVVHLTLLSTDKILLAVDYMGAQSGEDLIREFKRGRNSGATAWTIALSIEEVVLPYVDQTHRPPPLGAGLAIVEPKEVAVPEKIDEKNPRRFPILRSLNAGVEVAYLGWGTTFVDDVILGPRVGVESLLGPRFVASFSAGWLGTGQSKVRTSDEVGTVSGRVSYVPLDLLLGYVLVDRAKLTASILAGASAGFAIYRFDGSLGNNHDHFQYWSPWIQVRAETALTVYGPLGLYFNAGLGVPVMRDWVRDNDVVVYAQGWIMPTICIGLQLWNTNIK